MVFAMFLAACIDITVKALTSGYSTPQIVLVRTVFALPLVLAFCHFYGGLDTIFSPRWRWQIYRGLLAAGINFGFFYGLAYVPLVTAVLLAYISPVIIVVLSHFILKEQVGLQRIIGCLIGLAGVLCIVQPGAIEWNPGMLAILASALCWALLSLSNRQLAGVENAAALTFHTLPISGVIAAVLTANHWVQPQQLLDWLLFAIIGLAAGSTHFFVAMAYKHAKAATVAPLEYTNLIWAGAGAYFFWQEIPTLMSVIGGVGILLGGFLAVRAKN